MGKYYEELNIGDRFQGYGRTLTEADLTTFNGLTWNTAPLHNDREWVKNNTEYKDRIFPGTCTIAMAQGLASQMGVLDGTGLAILGITDVKFTAPVYPGDTIPGATLPLKNHHCPRIPGRHHHLYTRGGQ